MTAGNYQDNWDTFNYNLAEGNLSSHVRDLIDSVMGVYGGISCHDSTHTQQPGVSGALLTCFDTADSAKNMQADYTNNRLVIEVDGIYVGGFSCSFSGTTGSITQCHLRKNTVEDKYAFKRVIGSTGDVGDAGFIICPISLSAGDVLQIYAEVDGASDQFDVDFAQFYLRMIG